MLAMAAKKSALVDKIDSTSVSTNKLAAIFLEYLFDFGLSCTI